MSGNVLGGNLTVNLVAVTDEFKKKMNEAGGVVQSVVGKIEANKEVLRKTGLAFGAVGTAITAALGVSVKQAAAAGDQFEKMSKRTGESASTLSALAFAAERSGTSIGSVENAIKRAQRNMADAAAGVGEARGAFDALGISVANTDGSLKTGSEILLEFAEATAGMDDASRKAALAQEIFGRAGTDILPLLVEGAGGIKALTDEAARYGIVIDDVGAKQGADLVDAFANLGAAVKGVALAVGTVLQPVLTPVINKLADMAAEVSAFMREHEGLTRALGIIAGAFGVLATAAGALMLGATALPALIAAFSSLGGILAVSGPVGIALAAAAGLIYALYENWDVVCAGIQTGWDTLLRPTLDLIKGGFSAVWDTVKQVGEFIWGAISGVFTSISEALTPVIDLMIGGFSSTWEAVQTVFGLIWDKVSSVLESVYNSFRWLLDKLGVELPEMETLWSNIGTAGENAASGVMSKWTEMKDSFEANMKAKQQAAVDSDKAIVDSHVAAVDQIEEREIEMLTADDLRRAQEFDNLMTRIEKEDEADRQQRERENAANTEQMLKLEAERAAAHDEMVRDYGEMLTEEELAHAEFLKTTGGQWQEYIAEVTKPGPFEIMFEGVRDNFGERIDEMGDMWVENIHTGSFSDSFKFMGEYLKRTFESAIMDIEKNILKSFLDRVGNYLGGLFSGEGGMFDRLKSGFSGLIGDIGGGIGKVLSSGGSALATGAKAIGGTVLGTLGTAGSALASGAGTVGSAALGAIGALGVGTLGIGAAVAGIAYGISKLTEGKESKGGHARRLAAEYAGEDGGYIAPIAWANWQILEKDTNDNSKHGRSQAIKAVDQIMLKSLKDGITNSDDIYTAIYNYLMDNPPNSAWLAEDDKGRHWPSIYAGIAKDAYSKMLNNDQNVLTFHTGGIVPGILGQERMIRAYAGEEILRHDNPRHSNNFGAGSVVVNITGNTISSALDMQKLGAIAAGQIFDQLKLRTRITRY